MSGEVGVSKPDRRIFKVLFDRCSLVPERSVFIDDATINVESATELGMHAIRFTSGEALRRIGPSGPGRGEAGAHGRPGGPRYGRISIVSSPSIGAMFLCGTEPELLPGYAPMVEAGGYAELWLVEDCFFAGGVASTATALAVTTELTVGLGIMPAVMRNPATTAMEIAALERLYPGRVLPGIGHGVADWMRQIGALPRSQVTALEEVVVTVRALLAGETVTLHGEHVRLDEVRLDHPPAAAPTVSTGVRGPRSLALSGRVADGTILAEGAAPAYVRWARERIDEGMASAERGGPHRLTVYALFSVGEDGAEARRAVRPALASTLSGGGAAQVGPLGIAGEVAALVERGGQAAVRERMPDEWVEQLAVAGDPDECVAAIRALGDAGADTVVLVPLLDHAERQLARAAVDILPQLT